MSGIGNAISKSSTPADIGLGIAAAVIVVAAILILRQAGQLATQAEASYPGLLPER